GRDHVTVDALADRAISQLEEYQTGIPRENVASSLAQSLLDRGRWDEALEQAKLGRRSWHGGVPLAFMVEGLIRARRGEPGAEELLGQAWDFVAAVPEGWRHGRILDAPYAEQLARSSSELALWAFRCGELAELASNATAPVLRELAGDWRGAVR